MFVRTDKILMAFDASFEIPIYSEIGAVHSMHNGSGTQGVKELESKIRNESSAGYAKFSFNGHINV